VGGVTRELRLKAQIQAQYHLGSDVGHADSSVKSGLKKHRSGIEGDTDNQAQREIREAIANPCQNVADVYRLLGSRRQKDNGDKPSGVEQRWNQSRCCTK